MQGQIDEQTIVFLLPFTPSNSILLHKCNKKIQFRVYENSRFIYYSPQDGILS